METKYLYQYDFTIQGEKKYEVFVDEYSDSEGLHYDITVYQKNSVVICGSRNADTSPRQTAIEAIIQYEQKHGTGESVPVL